MTDDPTEALDEYVIRCPQPDGRRWTVVTPASQGTPTSVPCPSCGTPGVVLSVRVVGE